MSDSTQSARLAPSAGAAMGQVPAGVALPHEFDLSTFSPDRGLAAATSLLTRLFGKFEGSLAMQLWNGDPLRLGRVASHEGPPPFTLVIRNPGAIALAVAERDRARAELSLARLAASLRIAEAYRERDLLRARILRDQELVVRAQRVAAKSLTAYREGASALPAVLEARRTAREVLGQYIDDVAALLTLQAELGVLTQQVPPQ